MTRVAEMADLSSEWEAFSAEWIARCETNADTAREGLLDDWMLRLMGDIDGLAVIDLGCGEGRFCRKLAARGAHTMGVDLQPTFISHAIGKAGPRETYRLADMQSLDEVGDGLFDLAISYISLVDVPDQGAAIREAFRVLSPGGRFLVCNLSPVAIASIDADSWCRDDTDRKRHFALDDYTNEGPRRVLFSSGREITNFHRMLSTTVNDFLDAGFTLTRIYEPFPTAEQLDRVPENEDLVRVPIFIIYDLAKPPD
jgi:ubiquinone/menaquinone biosynthesis C-methylase UbiE